MFQVKNELGKVTSTYYASPQLYEGMPEVFEARSVWCTTKIPERLGDKPLPVDKDENPFD